MSLQKKATIVSTSVAAVLVTIKMTVGILSGSIAVLASAIDSFLDLCVSAFNYFALSNAEKAPDKQFNFGRGKIEAIAATVEGGIISISGLFVFYEAMSKIFHERKTTYLNESIIVMIVSIVITAALVIFLHKVAKKTGSLVIKADALHYRTDLYTNGAVIVALVLVSFSGIDLIDPILGIAIALYMIYSALPIIKEGVLMLMDAALSEEDTRKIKVLLDMESGINGYHHLKSRQSGSDIFISVHFVFDDSISLFDAHRVTDRLEMQIQKLFPDNRVHTIAHMDPHDDSDVDEFDIVH